jgi:homoserine kinase
MFTVRVPATIANMGPGFDSFGMAVSLYNRFSFESAEPGQLDSLSFSQAGTADMSALSGETASENIVLLAMSRLYEKAGQARPMMHVSVQADIPVTRGLGSSSTAIVAGLVAANRLLGEPFEAQALLDSAIEMEGHPDNVAPALLGGVVLYDTRPYALPWPIEWRVITLSPAYPIRTDEARRMLPAQFNLADAIFNLRKASVLTYALLQADPDALRHSLQDRLHQPYRRHLIAEYEPIEKQVMDAGAYGMIISGSGSTMAVFYPSVLHATLVDQLQHLITEKNWAMVLNTLAVDTEGAQFEADR